VTATIERLRRIGEVADEVGVTARTIRYYEQLGLLSDGDGRLKGTHRLYSQVDVDRLRELIRLRELLGLSLDELTQLADTVQLQQCLRTRWQHTTGDDERAGIVRSSIPNVERQLDLVHARQRSLADFEAQLIEKLAGLRQLLVELDSPA
jgi:MerR family transcriptional regulator, repressor of the yfmOP operon